MSQASRMEVYAAIDAERSYQDSIWGGTDHDRTHTLYEWLIFMQDYLDESMQILVEGDQYNPTEETTGKVLDIIRKVAAMGVACMEANGVTARKE